MMLRLTRIQSDYWFFKIHQPFKLCNPLIYSYNLPCLLPLTALQGVRQFTSYMHNISFVVLMLHRIYLVIVIPI